MESENRSLEKAELIAHLEAELIALEASMPEMERQAIINRALELFAVRCDIKDLVSEDSEKAERKEPPQSALRDAYAERRELSTFRLKNEFNIDHPERYPRSILDEMLSGDPGTTWGIVVVAKHDHNGAFDRTSELQELQNELSGTGKMIIVEASSSEQSAEPMEKFAKKHDTFTFAICLAHGSETGFKLGDEDEEAVNSKRSEEELQEVGETVREQDEVPPQTGEAEAGNDVSLAAFSTAFVKYSEPSATLVLLSCSAGGGTNSVGKQLARVTDRTVIAPDATTNGVAFNVTAHGSTIDFDPEYSGAQAREFKA